MGGVLSQLYLTLETFFSLTSAYSKLSKRVNTSPGIPIPNPSVPYWTIPPSPIAKHTHDELPEFADVVIIGSGITGTSFARQLLDMYYGGGKGKGKDVDKDKDEDKKPLKVVMLEARDACSGATGRNGGHVRPDSYPEYAVWKKKFGLEEARALVRFRRSHVEEMVRVAEEEGLVEDSQARRVQTYDVFYEKVFLDDMKSRLEVYLEDIPEEKDQWTVYLEDRESIYDLQLSDRVAGVISTTVGVLHPYRFVTGILERLLGSYPESFYLFTNTPCTSISEPIQSDNYIIRTPKGIIRAPHVIHATNGWASHLLEPMRSKIIPVRGVMTAQRPGTSLGLSPTSTTVNGDAGDTQTAGSWRGERSFLLFPGFKELQFDYLTQMPQPSTKLSSSSSESTISSPPKYSAASGELMYGGGFFHGGVLDYNLTDIGNVDDTDWDRGIEAYLSGALSSGVDGGWFGRHWGEEARPEFKGDGAINSSQGEETLGKGRVMKVWGGIMGFSADRLPWVGRLPSKIAGRDSRNKMTEENDEVSSLAAPGEWIAAGFSGEGMVQAWMCGKALACMVLDKDETMLPDSLHITEKRWRRARPEDAM
ncbi:FAD dependent oxidoreductase [Dendrothele bispora CBS 962.96]|uniref:FAD dependent oxidoreductase n=1 Tax=Dendrothele bispora (strain CBS 962.96) TaxID=1314807 RepID=A0A4S8MFJ0_DENBC|nr:FAD dependent oxidoreductase [Dendrothele bispora CBS 962.96]